MGANNSLSSCCQRPKVDTDNEQTYKFENGEEGEVDVPLQVDERAGAGKRKARLKFVTHKDINLTVAKVDKPMYTLNGQEAFLTEKDGVVKFIAEAVSGEGEVHVPLQVDEPAREGGQGGEGGKVVQQ
ncbi:unnamed protein product [Vitrella brassicaformis CCMP3155]|uniref:Uncharacterized protein n=1 Tax=Vitrella brassicaformis (strain CCMP3155) TaxID=1169540 RepID=A0A0G4FVZ1_VITBC|nr:unnamed protein product [Vitrella brassicaformis CCMP3155]|eukprot:CEM18780.1 unnamed protein product [Vitrella brassicaformis CCMP3155]